MRVTVIGAGVAGLTSALALAERGCAVEVVERGAGAGCRRPARAVPAACSRPGASARAPRSWWSSSAARRWTIGRRSTRARSARAASSSRHAATSPTSSASPGAPATTARLDAAGIAALEPDLAGRFAHGLFFPDEAHLDPRAALASLAGAPGGAGRADPLRRRCRRGCPVPSSTAAASPPATGCPTCAASRARCWSSAAREVSLSRPVRLLHPRFPLYIVPRADASVHDRRHHDRERRARPRHRPLAWSSC